MPACEGHCLHITPISQGPSVPAPGQPGSADRRGGQRGARPTRQPPAARPARCGPPPARMA